MRIFLSILQNNIAPIFVIIFIGFLMGKKFLIDIKSLTKIVLYVFVPSLVLVKVYETPLDAGLLSAIVFAVVLMVCMAGITILLSYLRGYDSSLSSAVRNSILFYNSGNVGLPLIMLVFQDHPLSTYAVSIQIMILMVQNLTTNTYGLYNANRGRMTIFESAQAVLRMPAVYAVASAFLLKLVPYDMTGIFIWRGLSFIANGLVPAALLTLGIQLSKTKLDFRHADAYIATGLRLIGGPLLALGLIYLFRFEGVMAQVLFISSGVPTAVNTALIALEFDNEPDLSSQVVLTTTLLSAFTLTGIIYLSRILF